MRSIKEYLLFTAFILGLHSFSLSHASDSMDVEEDAYQIGLKGLLLYNEGSDYREAAKHLRQALEKGQLTFAMAYADICLRNLDKGKHKPQEAAHWYVQAATSNDGDALAYLHSLSPNLLADIPEEQKVRQLVHIWIQKDADAGYELHKSGNFQEASKHLKRAAMGNHPIAQQLFADICLRQLDDKDHCYLDAAMWYLLAARQGAPEAQAYLASLIPDILQSTNHVAQMKAIVGCWVIDQTLPSLQPIKPKAINDYLISVHKRKIDKTTAQKIPYLFERTASAIIFNLTARAHSIIDDQLLPTADPTVLGPNPQNCALAARALVDNKFIRSPLAAFIFGPVYVSYFKSLDNKLKDGFLKMDCETPEISPIYQFLCDAIHETTKFKKAGELSSISHRDYPWLWAGIMFWKERYKEPFTSYPEDKLLQILTDFSEEISEPDLKNILLKLEQNGFWPNDGKHEICKKFNVLMHQYFINPLSRKEACVRETEDLFYHKLNSHELDCANSNNLEILKTPFLMYYCKNLTLKNFSSTPACEKAFRQGQRYFVDLEINVFLAADFNSKSKSGKTIKKLFDKVKKRGLKINTIH